GLARRILAALEADARAAGRVRMVLETGTKQPEAIALYTSSGYEPCEPFGYYRFHEESRCYAKTLRASPRDGATDPVRAGPRPLVPHLRACAPAVQNVEAPVGRSRPGLRAAWT